MENENLDRIKRISTKFRLLFNVLIVCIPILSLTFWLYFNSLPKGFDAGLPVAVSQVLSLTTIMLAFLITLLPISVVIYGLFTLKELFALYEHGIIFSNENVRCFRRLGYTLVVWFFAKLLFIPLISVVLTYNNPSGERMIAVGIGSYDLTTLITGAIVVTISWVMSEASKLQDLQDHTV